jgi:hypothetical protein
MLNHGVIENSQISYFKALKSCLLLVFSATVLYRYLDQYITLQIENNVRSTEGLTPALYVWISLSLINSILLPLLSTLICICALKNSNSTTQHFLSFVQKYFEFSLLENLRSWGKSFLWGLLFIIPGLIKMSYYLLVTYIVTLKPEYEKGEIDALQASEKLTKKHYITVSFLFFIFFMLIPGITSTLFDEWLSFQKHYFTATIYSAFEATMLLLFNFFILKYFLNDILLNSTTLSSNDTLSNKGNNHVTSV